MWESEKAIYDMIGDYPIHIDQIAREIGLDIAKVTSVMSLMEIKGKVKNLGGLTYIING